MVEPTFLLRVLTTREGPEPQGWPKMRSEVWQRAADVLSPPVPHKGEER